MQLNKILTGNLFLPIVFAEANYMQRNTCDSIRVPECKRCLVQLQKLHRQESAYCDIDRGTNVRDIPPTLSYSHRLHPTSNLTVAMTPQAERARRVLACIGLLLVVLGPRASETTERSCDHVELLFRELADEGVSGLSGAIYDELIITTGVCVCVCVCVFRCIFTRQHNIH